MIDQAGIPTRRVLSALTVLEIDGFVRQFPGKRYARLVELAGEPSEESESIAEE